MYPQINPQGCIGRDPVRYSDQPRLATPAIIKKVFQWERMIHVVKPFHPALPGSCSDGE